MLTKEQIRDRLQTVDVWVTTVRDDSPLFGVVPERKMRYVVAIIINNDTASAKTMDIDKLEEDGKTYTPKFSRIPIGANAEKDLPPSGYDIENPFIVLEGGTRLYGKASGVSLNTTIIYWDTPEI